MWNNIGPPESFRATAVHSDWLMPMLYQLFSFKYKSYIQPSALDVQADNRIMLFLQVSFTSTDIILCTQ